MNLCLLSVVVGDDEDEEDHGGNVQVNTHVILITSLQKLFF